MYKCKAKLFIIELCCRFVQHYIVQFYQMFYAMKLFRKTSSIFYKYHFCYTIKSIFHLYFCYLKSNNLSIASYSVQFDMSIVLMLKSCFFFLERYSINKRKLLQIVLLLSLHLLLKINVSLKCSF